MDDGVWESLGKQDLTARKGMLGQARACQHPLTPRKQCLTSCLCMDVTSLVLQLENEVRCEAQVLSFSA